MEEGSIPTRKPHSKHPQQNAALHPKPTRQGPGKSSSSSSSHMVQFLVKALFFAIFIMVVPMFPSQAPDFVSSHTLLTKFWELIHLVFIGIAVSYGLFSTRNVDMGFESDANVGDSESLMPRIFPVSSCFDDGYENPCGSGEKIVGEGWDSQCFVGKTVGAVSESDETTVFGAQCKPSLSAGESGVENFGGYKEKSVAQAWNSQYFQGESMVFVAQPNYGVNEWGKGRSIADNEPLGLPVRSLKSGVKNQDCFEFVTRGESGGAGSMAFPDGCNRSRNGKFGELSPINLEEKFNAAAASPSPVHWRSSSARMEKGKGEVARPSHFRPLSVDEAQFESLKTRSFRSPLSFSSETSQTSSMSSSPKEGSFANPMSSEVLNSKVENLKKRKCSQESSPSGVPSVPKPMPVNEKVSMSALHSRGYSIGSFNEEDLRRRSQDYLKELSGSRSGSGSGSEEDQLGSKEMGPNFLGSNMKPAGLSKASLRGKSVRTIRGSRLTTHEKVEKLVGNDETIAMRKYTMQNGATNNKSLGNGTAKLDFGNPLHMPKPTTQKDQKMQEFCGNTAGESEEDSESEAESFRASSDDEDEDASSAVAASAAAAAAAAAAKSKSVNVATSDSEVDKKAGEFIAKFREQIRLQKVASIDRSRGLSISSNCVR